jgi:uncharacterized UPF0160 family protein
LIVYALTFFSALAIIYKKIKILLKRFIEGIDGNDNGIKQYGDAIPLYQSNTDLPSRINFLNPEWNEEQDVNFDVSLILYYKVSEKIYN